MRLPSLKKIINGGLSLHGIEPVAVEFLPDSRLERVYDRINKELTLPEETRFADTVEAAHWVDQQGISVRVPERVYFWAVCPNPQPRWKGKFIKEYAYMDIDEWRLMEAAKWRYAGMPDPAYTIFKRLCEKLVGQHKSWAEMN